jgi:hypothetical protein
MRNFKMKNFCSFSEAIREGAKLRPQYFGSATNFERTATCAWGAGIEAIIETLAVVAFVNFNPYGLYPYLCQVVSACPACGQRKPLGILIFHLNDGHSWGREAIADWLESEEEKLGFITLVESEATAEESQIAPLAV